MTVALHPCPCCDGAGQVERDVQWVEVGPVAVLRACDECDGEGTVEANQLEEVRDG